MLGKTEGAEDVGSSGTNVGASSNSAGTSESPDKFDEEYDLDKELEDLLYVLDYFQRALRKVSNQYADAINDLLFVSHFDMMTLEKGNKIAMTELKAHEQTPSGNHSLDHVVCVPLQ